MTFRPCASSGMIFLRRRDLRALAAEPEHARDRVAPDVRVEHADLLALGLQRGGEVDGQRRLAHAALAGADAEDVGDLRQRALGQPAGAAERLLQAGLLLVAQDVEADVDAGDPVDGGHRLRHAGLEMAFDRAAGGRQRDRDVHGTLLVDLDGTDHPELDDRSVELRIDDDLQRLEDLVSRGHGPHYRRRPPPLGWHRGLPVAWESLRGFPAYAAASGRRGSIAARRDRSASGSSAERGGDLRLADAVGQHPEDRQVVGRQAGADRPQRARVERRPLPSAERVEQDAAAAPTWAPPPRRPRSRPARRACSSASAE